MLGIGIGKGFPIFAFENFLWCQYLNTPIPVLVKWLVSLRNSGIDFGIGLGGGGKGVMFSMGWWYWSVFASGLCPGSLGTGVKEGFGTVRVPAHGTPERALMHTRGTCGAVVTRVWFWKRRRPVMSELAKAVHEQVKSILGRIEKLNEEIDALNADKSDLWKEAKSAGISVPALKKVVAYRRKDPEAAASIEAAFDTYLGIVVGEKGATADERAGTPGEARAQA